MNQLITECTSYAFCDPAGDRKNRTLKAVRARSAIVVIDVDPIRRVFVRYAWAEKCSPEKLIERIEFTQKTFHPKLFGIEANAMQSLFASLVRSHFRKEAIKAALIPVEQNTHVDKDYRIVLALQPVISQGRLFVHKSMLELISELRGFPTHRFKDLVDALASAIMLAPARTRRSIMSDRREGLEKYLRATGATDEYIRQKLAERERNT